jgi:vesicular inhibitory amino acid transporter
MDMYASPAISIFSPSLNRISSSYLSSSYQRTRHSPHITHPLLADTTESQQQQIPFLPGRLEKGERHPEGYYATRADEHAKKKTDADYTTKVKAHEGSSVLQALLNGMNVLAGVGVLTTPYAVKEGGWLGLLLLFVLSAICCYTGILLRRCLESAPGISTYPDIGQAAFGNTGRLIIAVRTHCMNL